MKSGDACPHCGMPMARLPVVYVTSYQQCEPCNFSAIVPKAYAKEVTINLKLDGKKIAEVVAGHAATKAPR